MYIYIYGFCRLMIRILVTPLFHYVLLVATIDFDLVSKQRR